MPTPSDPIMVTPPLAREYHLPLPASTPAITRVFAYSGTPGSARLGRCSLTAADDAAFS